MGIIKSVIDLDLYKLTMQQAVIQHYPRARAKYRFFNRGKTPFPEGFGDLLRDEIQSMADLKLLNLLRNHPLQK